MSYINEALKKAQRDKDSGRKDYIHTIGRTASLKRSFEKKPVYIISIIILLAAVLIYSNSGRQAEQVTDTAEKNTDDVQVSAGDNSSNSMPDEDKQPQSADDATIKYGSEEKIISNREELYSQASYFLNNGKLKQAEGIFKEILSLDPGHINSLNDMGVLSLHEGRYEDAISFFEKAVRLKPKFANPYYNLACAYSLQNDVDRGMIYLLKAIEIDETVKDWANEDPDLQNLKEYAEFTAKTE